MFSYSNLPTVHSSADSLFDLFLLEKGDSREKLVQRARSKILFESLPKPIWYEILNFLLASFFWRQIIFVNKFFYKIRFAPEIWKNSFTKANSFGWKYAVHLWREEGKVEPSLRENRRKRKRMVLTKGISNPDINSNPNANTNPNQKQGSLGSLLMQVEKLELRGNIWPDFFVWFSQYREHLKRVCFLDLCIDTKKETFLKSWVQFLEQNCHILKTLCVPTLIEEYGTFSGQVKFPNLSSLQIKIHRVTNLNMKIFKRFLPQFATLTKLELPLPAKEKIISWSKMVNELPSLKDLTLYHFTTSPFHLLAPSFANLHSLGVEILKDAYWVAFCSLNVEHLPNLKDLHLYNLRSNYSPIVPGSLKFESLHVCNEWPAIEPEKRICAFISWSKHLKHLHFEWYNKDFLEDSEQLERSIALWEWSSCCLFEETMSRLISKTFTLEFSYRNKCAKSSDFSRFWMEQMQHISSSKEKWIKAKLDSNKIHLDLSFFQVPCPF